MAGIEILHSEPIMQGGTHPLCLALFIAGVVFGFIALVGLGTDKPVITLIGLCAAFGLIVTGAILDSTKLDQSEIETGRYRYEIILSEDVSLMEFYEKYTVVEQRSDIWIIEDKEIENEK